MNQLCTYDFTLPTHSNDRDNIIGHLKEWAKKWVFQEETSDSGYNHFQGRISLIKKLRMNELISKTRDVFIGCHWSITSSATHEGARFNYVMKADTRVAGPWKDDDEEPPKLTRQLRAFMEQEKYEWQLQLENMVQQTDDRRIIVIVDNEGNQGKSIFCEYLEYQKLAYEIPPFTAMEDVMQCAMSIKVQKAYLIDMPRGMKKEKLAGFYAGLESLKNGVMYDKRYAFKKRRIDRPQVVVFTNTVPDISLLSADRWLFLELTRRQLLPIQ